jgi:hypothetical protein
MKKKFLLNTFFLTFILLLIVGCSGKPGSTAQALSMATSSSIQATPTTGQRNPDIRGVITQVDYQNNQVVKILVQGQIEPDTTYDTAYIDVAATTQVFVQKGNSIVPGSVKDLVEKNRVEAFFVGPIRTSNPVQATAEKIVVIEPQ